MRGRRIPIALPNTGALSRRRHTLYIRSAIIIFILFAFLQFHVINYDSSDSGSSDNANYSTAAILQMVPPVFHKYLTGKPRNSTHGQNGTHYAGDGPRTANISDIMRMINRYNDLQTVLNEDIYGPLQNDSVIIVVQVHKRITYLRHLIVSLAQARGISRTLLVFSHDYYDDDINDLVQSIDFCKVIQIFYPFSIQTHPTEFPGADPGDCPRDIKKEQALLRKCNNALHPDLYGHYREAKFTQTKHHWWWKANRVFDQLEVTKYHTGMMVFLEEDHYVAEDFLYILELMFRKSQDLCPKCNILSLGTYLKTFNYYTYNKKVEVTPWISSKHNMGMAFNRTTWYEIVRCARHFCEYDDYNWDWSLQHVSQQCLKQKLHVMVVKGPRVFHIGECGVHHKKSNCESNQVISKVQQVLKVARGAQQLFPRSISLTQTSVIKKTKLRKGNGGWGDQRDHQLCFNMTLVGR
ncbi:alpha-1,6-mannosyl-glycoprotein 2-beta-N-acetylglucosaminyltransferase isoform X3 [Anopheles gambiae]|uniref:Alpha-1,6-mannosyl-glycoprotein 2-beta-N-acetylglucosaminyltransferase n=1 Tax=Anopheles gambiae TaxID=7165 RepID=A0A1S4GKW5_ANOGA|nr:alpha-1,6-mannosyl-glycoprotein 2-beta-N-acetylglucosaminyltransferase isoform X3 [Anopheles gambiae]XP_061498385.1 alpha-1,6-mannosyl-glycoprotein 2-beta-N-acetylglucosaminyltransferase isoform X3 [Anopheles gambiae]XP_061498386.1 alpha-1,6-mannosyl-glycoprotein 2-beta-N-acetylglucosaminyltransferase isoform X3 [Anopheles gambiae]XP_061498387.1 alpha-1,6-mannosyl-glycoprotein 2-beta-N-acetylglucosaminyltransferase isoform X3 [Anopheles gambiae]XP_061498388.1 alpha-1,6-mannosyl-glycoprotein 